MNDELTTTVSASEAEISERDRNIFQQVAVEGRHYDVVAKKEQLSVKQIRRVVQHVSRIFALRSWHSEAPSVRAMHLLRLEHQWGEAMLAWYRSQCDEVVLKATKKTPDDKPSVESVTTNQAGDVRYLEYARKLLGEIRQLGGVADLHTQGETYATVETLTIEQRTTEFYRLVARLREQARSDSLDRIGDGSVAGERTAADAAADARSTPALGQAASLSEP